MGGKRTGRPTGRPPSVTPEQFTRAYDMLVEGLSYREVCRTLGIPRTTLREKYPNMGWSLSEAGKLGHFIMSDQRIHKMQQEIGLLQK
jgi:DNA invertase Pin-like site-specific DNA recombinase